MCLALEAASLQRMESEKELSARTSVWICIPVAQDNLRGGARLIAIKSHLVGLIERSQFDRPLPGVVEGALQKVAL